MHSSRASYPTRFQSQWEATHLRVNVAVSGVTNAGGDHNCENQDAFFTFYDPSNGALVVGVLDGHGRDTGRDVAMAAKRYFEAQFHGYSHADYARLERDPQAFFQQLFAACHLTLKDVLREIYEQAGHMVEELQPEGFLVRHHRGTGMVANVRGGTTATIVVVLDGGRKIYTSNVGDSVALMGALRPVLHTKDVKIHGADGITMCRHDKTPSSNADVERDEVDQGDEMNRAHSSPSELLLLSGDHGPDCAAEFFRARAARCSTTDSSLPELHFLYDNSEPSGRRLPIFSTTLQGELYRNSTGDYYKNVRDEWATVVTTPATALFPDALAFTRSLGDFHMHAYGVSCEPTVMEMSLERVVAREHGITTGYPVNNQEDVRDGAGHATSDEHSNNNSEEPTQEMNSFMLVVASDGIWDNWKYDDLWTFLSGANRDKAMRAGSESCGDDGAPVDAMVSALMAANLQRAESYFGDQADNMTAMLCHFTIDTSSSK
ncbi:hypothetical protein BBJ28_00005096 [Nothophytophthora sp. Chile5]|nr:hypothetical protein BBJ28_00005096 [Nothophytophthora sp. Chile5]